jgi:gamma-glutamyltranspeptidase/glutathione hydrolase
MYKRTFILALVVMAGSITLVSAQQTEPARKQLDSSKYGVVASAHSLATEAGNLMLKKGGNAFDAIAAASFMLAVTEPSMSGLGGRLQAIYYKNGSSLQGIDATTQVPSGYVKKPKEEENGFATIGVPGMVKGIIRIQSENGKLKLKDVMKPAIEAASKGYPILKEEVQRETIEIKELRKYPSTKKHFLLGDSIQKGGDIFTQTALAKTLKSIARTKGKSFYQGKIASSLSEEITAGGGSLRLDDLKNYEALDAKMLKGSYRGYEIVGMGLPCYGAIVIEMLQMLEAVDLSKASEKDYLLYHAASHFKAYEDRPLLGTKEDSLVMTSYTSKRWNQPLPSSISLPAQGDHSNGHTTHLVASDAAGNVVSVTQSVGPLMGSKVASMKNGFMLATTMGPYLGTSKAGERAASHISPIIILKDGKPFMALGAAGGARIVPAIVQVISRVIDQGLSLDKALAAARVYQMPEKLLVENHKGIYWKDANTMSALKQSGNVIEEIKTAATFGRVHAAMFNSQTGNWIGAADPDWTGTVAGAIK